MQKWLSFIVPIYNAEKYLSECVESLLHQNFPLEKYEIILFDDGSTDSSLQIAMNYAKEYANIRVLTHPNIGVSETRNAALKEAVGEYIWYVDSDDYIAENVLTSMWEKTKQTHIDMLLFNSVRFKGDKYWRVERFVVGESSIKDGKKAFIDFYYETVLWNKLFRREFLVKNNLFFILPRLIEDVEYCTRCFYHADKVKSAAVDAYYYRILDTSLCHNEEHKVEWAYALLDCLDCHYKYMRNHPDKHFWIHAFILDLRRLHNGVDDVVRDTRIKKFFIEKEKIIVHKIISDLSISIQPEYGILLMCAVFPQFIINTQCMLRNIKRWSKSNRK
ncbi:glycosyltransferase [Bacteroides sp.]|uniref:glycosyltransferase n=1 Tax=Bacteroides sp. TaxID=29523 RepID=UPI003AB2D7DD